MKISCPSCSAKYSIADDKVQSRLAKIRCRKCGTSIVIDGNVNPPSVYAAAETADRASVEVAAPTQGTVFSVDFGEGDQRQLTVPQLVEAYNAGSVTGDTYLWAEGYADWTPLGQVDEVVSAIQRVVGTVDSNVAAAMSTAVEDPFPQPPAQSGADLFSAGRSPAREYSTSAAAAQARTPMAAAVAPQAGSRNESSVLFSLSALTSGSTSSRPSVPPPSAPVGDDSGLIDLKALTEAAAAQAPRYIPQVQAPVAMAPNVMAPLGSPMIAPLGVPAAPLSVPPKGRRNTGLFIIGGSIIVAAVAAAALVTLINKPEAPAPVAAQAPAPLPPPAAAPAALPEAAPSSLPELPSTDAPKKAEGTSSTKSSKPSSSTSSKKPATSSKPAASSSSSSSSSSAPSTPAPKPAKSKCNCRADDLMCNMKCAK